MATGLKFREAHSTRQAVPFRFSIKYLVQASSAVHDEWVLCQTRYNTLNKPLNMPHTRGYLPLDALVKGDSPTRTLLPIRPTGKKASPKAFVPFVLIQVGDRGFE